MIQKFALYPPLEARRSDFLNRPDGHLVYWEECGNPDGVPILFLHGGPGAGCSPFHRRYFDPSYYRIILVDQRGAGRSRPLAATHSNDTWALIEDLEELRRKLAIDQWILFGGSWGSTLSLAYAQSHPDRTMGLILRGIFLGREAEVEWFMTSMGRFFPEVEAEFLSIVPAEIHGDWRAILDFYYGKIMDPDPFIHATYARAWSRYEMRCCALIPDARLFEKEEDLGSALPLARLEAHYFTHRMFLEDQPILSHMDRIQDKPGIIIQGRYDIVCPPVSAVELHRAWPDSILEMVADAGHSATETGITEALLKATETAKSWSVE